MGFYKIGRARNVTRRVAEIQAANPLKLDVLATFPSPKPSTDETDLHWTFGPHRERGEWFRLKERHVTMLHRYFEYRNEDADAAPLTFMDFAEGHVDIPTPEDNTPAGVATPPRWASNRRNT